MTLSLEEQIRAMEGDAERSDPGTAAHILNRAGDMVLAAGSKERALSYYGRAIDANLYGRRYEAAAGLCRKVIRVSPAAVRTRCTLAWLALGHGDLEESVRQLGDYVASAIGAGQRERAAEQLTRMADVTADGRIRELIAAHLERLGQPATARNVRDSVRVHGAPPPPLDSDEQEALWTDVVNGALTAPGDL